MLPILRYTGAHSIFWMTDICGLVCATTAERMNGVPERRNRKWILGCGVLLGVLLPFLAFAGYKAYHIIELARSLQARLDDLQVVADGGADQGLREAGENLRDAHADLLALQSEVAFLVPLSPVLGWVPVIGDDLRAAPALLDVALSVTKAGTVAFDSLEPLVPLIEGDGVEGQPLGQVLDVLSDARPALELAQTSLAAAQDRRLDIDDTALSDRTAGLVAQLDRYLPLMQVALDSGRLLPDLLGTSGQRDFLVLAQNNDEMRATGGFISAVGLLTLNDGEIVASRFDDSYTVDDFSHPYPDSPPPFLRYMGIDQWVFRDANWSPDFPTSAQKAVELYRISRDLDVDAVLAVDQHALKAIVSPLAPLEVEGWPEPVTGDNVIALIRMAWSSTEDASNANANWWPQRKRFMGDLFGALQGRVEANPEEVDWLALARAIFSVLDERHVQIWLTEPTSAAVDLLNLQGWDGAIRQAPGDYVMVVDSNLGFNKVNAIVKERLDYRVRVSVDETAQATLTVRHVHLGSKENGPCDPRAPYGADYDALVNRCYWNYMRVYVPAGSQLVAATPHPVAGDLLITGQGQSGTAEVLPEENDKAVFGSFFVLPRGDEIETRFVYQLPHSVLERTDAGWRYRLTVQKQAGTRGAPVRVTLVLPPGSSVHSVASSGPALGASAISRPDSDTVVFESTLEKDRVFEVTFQFHEP